MKELEEKLQLETNKVQQLEKVLKQETLKGEKLKNELEQESNRVLELNKKLEESHKVQELATHADCQANVVELEQELEGVRDSAARSLASQQEELARTVATMDTHNGQIADLKQDLNKRNVQVIGFVQKLKEIKESLAGQGRNPSPDLLVEEVGSIGTTRVSSNRAASS